MNGAVSGKESENQEIDDGAPVSSKKPPVSASTSPPPARRPLYSGCLPGASLRPDREKRGGARGRTSALAPQHHLNQSRHSQPWCELRNNNREPTSKPVIVRQHMPA